MLLAQRNVNVRNGFVREISRNAKVLMQNVAAFNYGRNFIGNYVYWVQTTFIISNIIC